MSKDFRAKQVRTNKIIGRGKPAIAGSASQLQLALIKSGSANFAGGVTPNTGGGSQGVDVGNLHAEIANVGSDVWLLVDGGQTNRNQRTAGESVLFLGDVVVSGTLYAERQRINITTTGLNEVVSDDDNAFILSGSTFIDQDRGLSVGKRVVYPNNPGAHGSNPFTDPRAGLSLQTQDSVFFDGNTTQGILVIKPNQDSNKGRIGIGVSDPDSKLEIFGTDTHLKLSYDADNYATLAVGANGNLTVTTVDDGGGTAGELEFNVDGPVDVNAATAVTIDSTGGAISIGADANAQAINIGTGAAARTITIGNATGATEIDVNTGTGGFKVDTQSGGGISLDAVAAASNLTVSTGGANEKDLTLSVAGGGNSSLFITSDGTGADSLEIDTTVGSMTIGKSLADGQTLKIGKADTVQMVFSPHGTAGNEKWSLINTSGTAADAIKIDAVAGGLDIDAGGSGGVINIDANSSLTMTSATADVNVVAEANNAKVRLRGDNESGTSIHLQGNANAASIVDIDAGILDIDSDGLLTIDSSAGQISIGADNVNQNINIGTDGQREITIGDAAASNSAGLTLRANTGGINIDCQQATGDLQLDTAGGAIQIGHNAAAGNISIGTNATQRTVTVGNTTDATALVLNSGTGDITATSTDAIILDASGVLEINSSGGVIGIGNDAVEQAINVGTGAAARTITIGNETGATAIDIDAGTGGVAIDSQGIGAIGIGTQADTGAINIGTGASARTITVGNNTGATGLSFQAGTNGVQIASTGAGDIVINSDDKMLLDSDGDLEINASLGVINIGNDNVNQNINIGTDGTRTITIGEDGEDDKTFKVHASAANIELDAGAHNVNVTGGLIVSGDLTVNGSFVETNVAKLTVEDPLIELARNQANNADTLDIGFFGKYGVGGTHKYAGLFRDANDSGKFHLFKDATENLTDVTAINRGHSDYAKADLVVNLLNVDDAGGITATNTINLSAPNIELGGDGAILKFGADDDVTLTHVADTGLVLNTGMQLQFGDSATHIKQFSESNLEIESDASIILDTPTIDFEDDGVVLAFGDNSEVTLTHVHNAGLLLNSEKQIQFGHADENISGDGTDLTFKSANDFVFDFSSAEYPAIRLKSSPNAAIKQPSLVLERIDSTIANLDYLGALSFGGREGAAGDFIEGARIQAKAVDDFSVGGILKYGSSELAFSTRNSAALTRRMVLSRFGHLGIGVDDPDTRLEVLSTSTQQKWSYDGDSFATMTVAADSHTTLAAGESGNITLDSVDINLTASGDVNIPASVGLTFGADTNKIEVDGSNDMTVITANDMTFQTGGADADRFLFRNGGNTTEETKLCIGDTSTFIERQGGSNNIRFVSDRPIQLDSGGTLTLDGNSGVNIKHADDATLSITRSTDTILLANHANDIVFKTNHVGGNGNEQEIARFATTAGASSLRMADTHKIEFTDAKAWIQASASKTLEIQAGVGGGSPENGTINIGTGTGTTKTAAITIGENGVTTTTIHGLTLGANLSLTGDAARLTFDGSGTDPYIERTAGSELRFTDGSNTNVTLSDLASNAVDATAFTTIAGHRQVINSARRLALIGSGSVGGTHADEIYGYNATTNPSDAMFFVSGSVGPVGKMTPSDEARRAVFDSDMIVSGSVMLRGLYTYDGAGDISGYPNEYVMHIHQTGAGKGTVWLTGDLTFNRSDAVIKAPSSGDLEFQSSGGNSLMQIDGANGAVVIPSDSTSKLGFGANTRFISNPNGTNDIKIEATGNVDISGGKVVIGSDVDDSADRSIVFGHAVLKSRIGIDDDQDVFAINTDQNFESSNDFEIDASGNVTVGNGNVIVDGGHIQGPTDGQLKLYADTDVLINIDRDGSGTDAKFKVQTNTNTTKFEVDESGNTRAYGTMQIDGNQILASDGGTAITLDTADNVTVGNNLILGNNQINNSDNESVLTLSADQNATFTKDLTVGGGDLYVASTNTQADLWLTRQQAELISGNEAGRVMFRGTENGSDFANLGAITMRLTEAFAEGSNHGCAMDFYTTPNAANANTKGMMLSGDNNLTVYGSVTAASLDLGDGNITNAGSIACDSILPDAAAAGLNINMSSGNTGTSVITLGDNLADALSIKDNAKTFLTFDTRVGGGSYTGERATFNVGIVAGSPQSDQSGYIEFMEASTNGSNKITLKALEQFTSDITLTLPASSNDTLVGMQSAQTLSNKTLALPRIDSGGSIVSTGGHEILNFMSPGNSAINYIQIHSSANSGVAGVGNPLKVLAAGDDTNIDLQLSPKGTGVLKTYQNGSNREIVTDTDTQTLTGKTINLTSNTLAGTFAQFNTACSDKTLVSTDGTETLTNKTLTTPIIATIKADGDSSHTVPNVSSDTFALIAASQTLTNKSIALGNNTVTGNLAAFNTALSDGSFCSLAGTESLTNKTFDDMTAFTAGLRVSMNSDENLSSIHAHETQTDFARISLTNATDTNGSLGDYSHEWTLAGKSAAQNSASSSEFHIWYGDAEGSGTGANILTVRGDKKVGINEETPDETLHVKATLTSNGVGNSILRLEDYRSDNFVDGEGPGIKFAGGDAASANNTIGRLNVLRDGADNKGRFRFNAGTNGSVNILNLYQTYVEPVVDVLPAADNTLDLGSPSKRFANLYTGDLHLNNMGSGNDVDGTSGNWTIQEGKDNLYVINNLTGKKFKMALTPVDEGE